MLYVYYPLSYFSFQPMLRVGSGNEKLNSLLQIININVGSLQLHKKLYVINF